MEKPRQTGESGAGIVAVLASVALVHVAWWLVGDSVVVNGNLVDSDGYARLVRIERLVETGGWFETLAKAEKSHPGRFQKALDTLD